jgi:hypothetical protein
MVVVPLVFTLGTRWRSVVRLTLLLGKEPPVPIGQDIGWTPETSLDVMGKNLLPLPGIETQFLCHRFCSLGNVPSTLF